MDGPSNITIEHMTKLIATLVSVFSQLSQILHSHITTLVMGSFTILQIINVYFKSHICTAPRLSLIDLLTDITMCSFPSSYTSTCIIVNPVYAGRTIEARATFTLIDSWKTQKDINIISAIISTLDLGLSVRIPIYSV